MSQTKNLMGNTAIAAQIKALNESMDDITAVGRAFLHGAETALEATAEATNSEQNSLPHR